MKKLFGLVLLLMIVSLSYGAGNNVNKPPLSSGQHYTNLIVGGGPAGLYTAWRLSSERSKNETTAIFEWSPFRLGGRVFTKTFPGGQFLELGAMRLKPHNLLLRKVLQELNLSNQIRNFSMTENRLYHLRGTYMYQSEIPKTGAPYNTTHNIKDPQRLFDEISERFYPFKDTSRARTCKFFDEGVFPPKVQSAAFKENDILGNIGYWNLLIDQLGGESLAYATDANGYTSSSVNSNAAYSIAHNRNVEPIKFLRLEKGYVTLINALEEKSVQKHVTIKQGQRLTEFYWDATERKFHSTFLSYDKNGASTGTTTQVTSDRLFLCVPKHSLDLIRETDVIGSWPAQKERRVLKHSQGEFYISSVIQEPSYKVGLIYKDAWWYNATYPPDLDIKKKIVPYDAVSKNNYGPTVTDLPIRGIYYFGNNKGRYEEERYGILATYDDMRHTYFWGELELPTNETLRPGHPMFLQPLFPCTEVTETMEQVLREELNKVHYGNSTKLQVPHAEGGCFMNWGHEPYGAGYHIWRAHYKIAEAQHYMTRPSEAIGMDVPIHVAGETYSYDQGWIEGAFTTAEAVLVEKIGLKALKLPADYPLICPFKPKEKKQ